MGAGGSAGMSCTSRRPAGESGRDCTYQRAPTPTIICNVELQPLRANLEPTLKNRRQRARPPTLHPPPTTSTSYLQSCNAVPVCAKTRKTIAYLFPPCENSNNCSGGSGDTLPGVNLPLPIVDVEGAFSIGK